MKHIYTFLVSLFIVTGCMNEPVTDPETVSTSTQEIDVCLAPGPSSYAANWCGCSLGCGVTCTRVPNSNGYECECEITSPVPTNCCSRDMPCPEQPPQS